MDFAITLSALQPFHHIEPTSPPATLRRRVDRLLHAHAPIEGETPLEFVEIDFDAPGDTRSRRFQKHAWRTIGPIFALHAFFGDERWLRLARHYASRWMEALDRAPEPHDEAPGGEGVNHFAWYDMAVGLRASRLAYLLDRLARAPDRDEALIDQYAHMLARHLDFLTDEANFARHSNHGMFEALGYLSACRRFPDTPWIAAHAPRAEAMFAEMVAQQFHPDGVHREHSPGYHDYFVQLFHSGLMDGLLRPADFPEGLLEAAEQALFWMVAPNGTLLAFGDTNPKPAGRGLWRIEGERERAFAAKLRYGWRRRRDEIGAKLYPDAGLAFIRARGKEGTRSYLAFNGGFHSRVHKQADDLSMVWFEGGDAILADPGSYGFLGRTEPGSALHEAGFWYGDLKRVYVETTAAHNCVEIDGRSHPRRDAPPYGSAIARVR
ncbi:MAG: heparinase II/III family protein, partial [Sphingomonadaceae bacterium]|nr:heparinase II/III family protein [Sphingomonadaceae bacterium]